MALRGGWRSARLSSVTMSTFTSQPGTRLGGRYRLEDRLAAAGGWSAWKAIDEILARPVSVITFASGFPRLEQVVTAARAASRLTDTRLAQVFDVEDTWDRAYIVLEWPVGETLADLLSAGPLEPLSAARIVADTAGALSAAHAAGLAHLCLRPEAVRWTPGGGVKITGLGIDAALAGISSDDPELADTHGLGQLFYASLTGLWPGPEDDVLRQAPMLGGEFRRPRQVRAGVPTVLDDVAGRALPLAGHDGRPYTSPSELAAALRAAVPPVVAPPTPIAPRTRGYPQDLPPRRRAGKLAAVTLAVLVVVAALIVGALHLIGGGSTAGKTGGNAHGSSAGAHAVVLKPASAHGFDALNPADTGDENNYMAPNVLTGAPTGWATQQYYGPAGAQFGGYKSGTGLILDMGRPVKVSSIRVRFGNVRGADVEIKVGQSSARTAQNVASMTTVASADDVAGLYTFTISKPVAGRYLVIWFTRLPPMAGEHGKYMAQVFSVLVKGTD